MNPELAKRIADVAADVESGASEILESSIAILRDAQAGGGDLRDVAQALRAAQPSMAPIWNVTAAALAGDLDRFVQRAARAPEAIARWTADLLERGLAPAAPVRIVTLSYSGTVAHAVEQLSRRRAVQVSCCEGRPALEGRHLAARLASRGIPIAFYLDAAAAFALEGADAVLVGADAIGPDWFLNKIGTRLLATAAADAGVPVYILAGREKFVPAGVAAQLTIRNGSPDEVWAHAPPGVTSRNPYFEHIPLRLVAAVVVDAGVIGPAEVPKVCSSG